MLRRNQVLIGCICALLGAGIIAGYLMLRPAAGPIPQSTCYPYSSDIPALSDTDQHMLVTAVRESLSGIPASTSSTRIAPSIDTYITLAHGALTVGRGSASSTDLVASAKRASLRAKERAATTTFDRIRISLIAHRTYPFPRTTMDRGTFAIEAQNSFGMRIVLAPEVFMSKASYAAIASSICDRFGLLAACATDGSVRFSAREELDIESTAPEWRPTIIRAGVPLHCATMTSL